MEARMLMLFLLLCSNWLSSSFRTATAISDNTTDRLALLAFKNQLTDPHRALSSWNDTTCLCDWEGVSCSRTHPLRVTALDLSSRGLAGTISPSIGNLTFLRSLVLGNNGLSGVIVPEIGRLRRLQRLNLSDNSFYGEIPINLTYCSALQTLSLFTNQLSGRIPADLGFLSKLDTLSIGNNSISGPIPPSLGNLSSLTRLSLPLNHLEGSIPEEFGNLARLVFFQAALNNLSGMIPPSFYNLSSLFYFGVAFNQRLQGSLPPDMGITLPNLGHLLIAGNQFHGPIPASLTNITGLAEINIAFNNFTGKMPSDLGRLQGLSYLNLGSTRLEANDANDWKFVDSLTNCSRLWKLIMSGCRLRGVLPDSVANLSTQLQRLEMGNNQISGSIPSEIGNLVNLNTLEMQGNLFTGVIPEGIGKLRSLDWLALFGNKLGGHVPSSIGNLTQLSRLRLDVNKFEGFIPSSLGNLQNLVELDLSFNNLSGTIPKEVFSLPYIANYIDLSYNNLVGSLPLEVGGLKRVRSLLLAGNMLSGEVPGTLGNCDSLEYLALNSNFFNGSIPSSLSNIKGLKGLNLSHNSLSGTIPASFSNLNGLQELYLSYNNLSGSIPEFLENITSLYSVNLSFNHLQGPVPVKGVFGNATEVLLTGNDGLCGGIPQLHLPVCPVETSKRRTGWSLLLKILIPTVGVIICLLMIASIAFLWSKRKLRSNTSSQPAFRDQFPKVSYRELAKATDGFSSVNLIGEGRYGKVYKGNLDGGNTVVAVKVFNLHEQGATKSFMAECEALRIIRHRNLIKILTSCSSIDSEGNDFKALVFEFMPNGSLEGWLYPREDDNHESNHLSLTQRLNIAIDVADALDYLHHYCQPPVIHCDLKPSNVLLDSDMSAHVGDFGLAKFFYETRSMSLQDSSSSFGIRGSIGYIPPEYGTGGQVSTFGDVYSFGILLLEMFTGKNPINDKFKDGITLHNFVAAGASFERIIEITDPSLLKDAVAIDNDEESNIAARKIKECLVSTARIGLRCSNPLPSDRMEMRDAATEMHAIRDTYVSDYRD